MCLLQQEMNVAVVEQRFEDIGAPLQKGAKGTRALTILLQVASGSQSDT